MNFENCNLRQNVCKNKREDKKTLQVDVFIRLTFIWWTFRKVKYNATIRDNHQQHISTNYDSRGYSGKQESISVHIKSCFRNTT